MDQRVLEAMLPYFSEKFGNAASRTHAFGWVAEDAVKTARQQVAKLINCLDQEIVFTSGATEAINLAIKGVYDNYQTKGNHIITVKTEHKAVLDSCHALEKRGANITYLNTDANGLIDLEELKNTITTQTILVAVMYANNETGVIQPIKEIAAIVHQHNAFLFCDATQAVGKLPVDVQAEHIDLMCFSAHKFYGPKGVGGLYVRRKDPRVSLSAQMDGGGHERGLRSGTLNVPGIVGLGKACEIAAAEMNEDAKRISDLRNLLETELAKNLKIVINGSKEQRLYNTSNIVFKGQKAASLINKLPHIALAMGSACTSAVPEPSHVLKAMGLSDEDSYASVRFSLGKKTTEKEIAEVIESLVKLVIN